MEAPGTIQEFAQMANPEWVYGRSAFYSLKGKHFGLYENFFCINFFLFYTYPSQVERGSVNQSFVPASLGIYVGNFTGLRL